jgi:zinc protease
MRVIEIPDSTPLISLRLVFHTGAADDPAGKPGVAKMTAMMLAAAGSRKRSYQEILDALFPTGSHIGWSVDKEMVSIRAEAHAETIEAVYSLLREMLLDPGWREDDFERLREDSVNYLEVTLRGQNDEELGKEALQSAVFRGHPYEHESTGTVSSLKAMTLDDLRDFYKRCFTIDRLTAALGGGYPPGLAVRVESDFRSLGERSLPVREVPEARSLVRNEASLIEKPARSVAISLGHPIDVTRGHPDYPALLLAQSCLGQHRMSSGRLFTRMRQIRGLNYGDYAYIEYFPGGMYTLEPPANVARSRQLFELWIRPVERQQAHFALRLALHELQRFVEDGITREEFERTRSFLTKYPRMLMKTRSAQLGYAVDSAFYGIPPYSEYLARELPKLSVDTVNEAIRRHLRFEKLVIVAVGEGMREFREALLANAASPMTYNSPKADEVLAEDALVSSRMIPLEPDAVRIIGVEEMFA